MTRENDSNRHHAEVMAQKEMEEASERAQEYADWIREQQQDASYDRWLDQQEQQHEQL